MSNENEAIVRRWFEQAWNERRAETIDEILTDESVCFTDHGPMRGPEQFRQMQYIPLLGAFPELRVTIDQILSQGEDVVVRWSAHGKHAGDGLGIPATQEQVQFHGMSWIRVRGGKFAEGWQNSNIAQVLGELAAKAKK